jgi:Flp pilus assembly pilin Flp
MVTLTTFLSQPGVVITTAVALIGTNLNTTFGKVSDKLG